MIVAATPLLLMVASNIGWSSDYDSYVDLYERWHSADWQSYLYSYQDNRFELAFFALCKYIPSHRLLIILSTISLFASYLFLFKQFVKPQYYWLAFVLWFYHTTFFESYAAMRSSFVVSLFSLAIYFRCKNQFWVPIVITAISGFFHNSGFFMIPLVLIPPKILLENYKFSVFVVCVILGITILFPDTFHSLLIDNLEDSKLSFYSSYVKQGQFGLGYYILTTFRIMVIATIFIEIKKRLQCNNDGNFTLFAQFAIIYLVMNSIPNMGLTYRISCYLRPMFIITICYLANQMTPKYQKPLIFLVIFHSLFEFSSFFSHPNFAIDFSIYKSSYFIDLFN